MFTSSFSPRFNDVHFVVDIWNKSFDGCDNEQESECSFDIGIDDNEIKFDIDEERRTGIFGVVDLIVKFSS